MIERLESAIRKLAADPDLLARFKTDPQGVGGELGLTPEWVEHLRQGDRSRLRSLGLNDGLTIIVGRWLKDDVADSASTEGFHVDRSTPLAEAVLPANLVFAGACSHVPDILARPEIDPPEAVERLLSAYRRLGDALAASDPDVLLVTSDSHFQSFRSAGFVIGDAATHYGSLEFFKRPDIDLTLAGAPDVATEIVAALRGRGYEIESSSKIELDHGLIVPLRQMLPRQDLPVVPILTQPARSFSPFNARAIGAALREIIAGQKRRVAVLATGGLSHFLDPGKFGRIDVEFDTYILDMMAAGKGAEIGNLEPLPLLEHGQYEFLNWLIMLGLVGDGVRGEVYAYEPLKASGGGWAVVNMPFEPVLADA
jgi:aromatic ring-opening dioxygenase catalytic subunit (LigB family)